MSTTTTKPTTAPVLQLDRFYVAKEPCGSLAITQSHNSLHRYVERDTYVTIRQEDVPALRDWLNEQWPKEV